MSMSARLTEAIRCFCADRRGVAATEFALLATAFLLLLLGLFDIATAVQQRMVLQQAVLAGANYAMSFPTQTAGIKAAMQAALPNWPDATFCVSSSFNDDPSCPSPSAGSGGAFITLSISRSFTPFLFMPGNCNNGTANCASYVIRVQ